MARLVVITSEGRVWQIQLERQTTTVGRADQSDIVVRGPLVSRVHALIALETGAYSVRDLDSSNGTFVNGLQVRRQMLRHEDVIRMGDTELRFLEDGSPPRMERTTIHASA